MRVLCLLMGLSFIASVVSAEQKPAMHTWKPANGNAAVDAVFVKISEKDPACIVLKCKDGREVTAKMADLCDEDRAYVKDLTHVSRDVIVTFKKKNSYGGVCEETGKSQAATIGDTVTLRVPAEGDNKKAEETRWTIHSADVLGNRIKSTNEHFSGEMVTEGKFVFLTFTVANDSDYPVTVPSPVLVDKRGRKFLQSDKSNAQFYIPANTTLPFSQRIQPGLKELFCSFYELPINAEPALVEVFPAMTESYAIQRFEAKGKQIVIDEEQPVSKQGDVAASPSASDKKLNITLNATKTKQGGDSQSGYYSSLKTRSYTYQVDLRLLTADIKQAPVTVKVFFTGAVSNNRNLVVDHQEKELTLDQGKNSSETFTSKEIQELRGAYFYYYYSNNSRVNARGAQLNGVIVQVWNDSGFIKGISKGDSQLKKYEESLDVVKDLGELKQGEN